jgi:hypothetical protein
LHSFFAFLVSKLLICKGFFVEERAIFLLTSEAFQSMLESGFRGNFLEQQAANGVANRERGSVGSPAGSDRESGAIKR